MPTALCRACTLVPLPYRRHLHLQAPSELDAIATVAAPSVPEASSVGNLEDGYVPVEGVFQQYRQKLQHVSKVRSSMTDQVSAYYSSSSSVR